MWWHAIGAVIVLVVAWIVWRLIAVQRGARLRDERIMEELSPFLRKLDEGADLSNEEVTRLCAKYHLRPMLYSMLKHYERLEIFPDSMKSLERQAEGLLAHWMMHPNEFEGPPVAMQIMTNVERKLGGKTATFVVVKFQMPPGHWVGDGAWPVGLSGPFFDNAVPYGGKASAFSRASDAEDKVRPDELVDWFIDMVERKGGGPW